MNSLNNGSLWQTAQNVGSVPSLFGFVNIFFYDITKLNLSIVGNNRSTCKLGWINK